MEKNFLAGIKGWKKFVLVYGIVLLASHLVVWLIENPIEEEQTENKQVTLQTVHANQTISDRQIQIEYEDVYKGEEPNPQVLLLLPGGWEGPEVFEELIPELSSKYRIIIPHLPGFGNEEDLPDYSFRTLSNYTNQLLEKLELSDIHVMGYGLGGASAIYLAHNYPKKLQSLTLASSIGVQELELLGSYRLNNAVHGVQLAGVWLMHNAIPHFGLIELIEIDVSYAKSHYESDQRPLRSYLKQYDKPMMILHGREDPLVPLAVANEHHRIVPQSNLEIYDAGHDLIQTHSDSVSQTVSKFIESAQAGEAPTSADASQERISKAQQSFSNVEFAQFTGASLAIIMIIIVLSTFISEDLTCIGAGLLAARGLIGFWPATIACLIGIFVGDMALYIAGRLFGRRAAEKAPFRWFINERDLQKSAQWFRVRGPAIIIATRFLPGSRLPTYFSAGVLKANFWMFTFYFLLAAIVWTPMLVGISQLLGNELLRYFYLYQDYALWVFLGAIVFLIMIVKVIIPVFSYKGRRLLISRYRRLTRWEYWSPIILYTPVCLYVLFLGIKHRCLTLFTAANPAIPDGGFIGESKTEILDLFDSKQAIAEYCCISSNLGPAQRVEKALQFMGEHNLTYPVVLKPDVGERGKGVEIIRDSKALEEYFSEQTQDVIIQEYIEGEEYGIFYYRRPDESEGDIFSITTVELLCVEGDGERTIQELILDNNQTVSLAKFHLRKNEDRLFDVPEEGEGIPIVELGTHARGGIFGDGENLITEALVDKMNELCESTPGFYFGRFDLKAPSDEHLKKGMGLKIIEVNGVSSESTDIYDTKYSFFDAQKILWNQWKLAFKIGSQNRQKGAKVSSFFPFVKRVFKGLSRG